MHYLYIEGYVPVHTYTVYTHVQLSVCVYKSQSSKVVNTHYVHDTYGVILRIVKAGCHPAIAQVVEH